MNFHFLHSSEGPLAIRLALNRRIGDGIDPLFFHAITPFARSLHLFIMSVPPFVSISKNKMGNACLNFYYYFERIRERLHVSLLMLEVTG